MFPAAARTHDSQRAFTHQRKMARWLSCRLEPDQFHEIGQGKAHGQQQADHKGRLLAQRRGTAHDQGPEQGRQQPEQYPDTLENGILLHEHAAGLPGLPDLQSAGRHQQQPEQDPGIAGPARAPGDHGIVIVPAKVIGLAAQEQPYGAKGSGKGKDQGQGIAQGAQVGLTELGREQLRDGDAAGLGQGQGHCTGG